MGQINYKKLSQGVYEKTEVFEDVKTISLDEIETQIQLNEKLNDGLDSQIENLKAQKEAGKVEIKRLRDLKKHLTDEVL
jgi:hypothetical protein